VKLAGKVVVVTGGGGGIGRALCRRFSREGLAGLVVADLLEDAARTVAEETGGIAVAADAGSEADIRRTVELAEERFGRIDLYCSNAGIMVRGGEEVADSEWNRIWDVNVMAHVWAARAVLPSMLKRGGGYLLQTASAAGLLNQIGSAPYAVTKHAVIGFAEWLAIEYGDRGISVSCVCPQGVRTAMLAQGDREGRPHFLAAGALDPEQVAEEVVCGLDAEQFLILPHPEVLEYYRRKSADYDRWLRGMRRLREKVSV
jgi:NAD(P)-dependent dehydrogenase (short-subunit alcohol dehydrogenase family)